MSSTRSLSLIILICLGLSGCKTTDVLKSNPQDNGFELPNEEDFANQYAFRRIARIAAKKEIFVFSEAIPLAWCSKTWHYDDFSPPYDKTQIEVLVEAKVAIDGKKMNSYSVWTRDLDGINSQPSWFIRFYPSIRCWNAVVLPHPATQQEMNHFLKTTTFAQYDFYDRCTIDSFCFCDAWKWDRAIDVPSEEDKAKRHNLLVNIGIQSHCHSLRENERNSVLHSDWKSDEDQK